MNARIWIEVLIAAAAELAGVESETVAAMRFRVQNGATPRDADR
jgi:hypothetical protein